jgi:hypothetical protein
MCNFPHHCVVTCIWFQNCSNLLIYSLCMTSIPELNDRIITEEQINGDLFTTDRPSMNLPPVTHVGAATFFFYSPEINLIIYHDARAEVTNKIAIYHFCSKRSVVSSPFFRNNRHCTSSEGLPMSIDRRRNKRER